MLASPAVTELESFKCCGRRPSGPAPGPCGNEEIAACMWAVMRQIGGALASAGGGSVAVTLARPLHVSKVGQSKKGKTKQATLISDFHAHGSKSSLWPIGLARS